MDRVTEIRLNAIMDDFRESLKKYTPTELGDKCFTVWSSIYQAACNALIFGDWSTEYEHNMTRLKETGVL